MFKRLRWGIPVWLFLSLVALLPTAGCRWFNPQPTLIATLTPSPVPGSPTPTGTPTATPTGTPTPTATPTPTPIPPLQLSIEFPRPVDALQPVPIRVRVEEPPGVDAHVALSARVIDANNQVYDTFDMTREGEGDWWVADGALQLPLEPEPYPGVWHLSIDAQADLPVRGFQDRVFTPQRVPYRVLTDTLPTGVILHVPQAFPEIVAEGDPVAGRRGWSFGDCEITLAWAPGPTEALLLDNAQVMADASRPLGEPVYEISQVEVEELAWGAAERTAFLFYESWERDGLSTPAETLVVQAPNFRLLALRIRSKSEADIHPLCRDVRATLAFVEE